MMINTEKDMGNYIVKKVLSVAMLCALLSLSQVKAHQTHENTHQVNEDKQGSAHYLGNEALLVIHGGHKVLFDPFFHNDFGFYQKVPEHLREKMFKGIAPFNDIDVIVISHAHEDHFSAEDIVTYLNQFPQVTLVGPSQAIAQIQAHTDNASVTNRLLGVSMSFGDAPWQKTVKGIQFDAVRIPHAGWPRRADVENMVFRLAFDDTNSVIHMGDADPLTSHYVPYNALWDASKTKLGFPPYWFLTSAEGRYILNDIMHIEETVGVHVPLNIPALLEQSGKAFFNQPGSIKTF